MRRGLALFLLFVLLSLTVNAGWWRPLDWPLLYRLATGSPCWVIQAGFRVSPWLSAQYTVVFAALLSVALYWRTRRWTAVLLLAGLLATAPVELVAKHTILQLPPRRVFQIDRACGPENYGLATVTTPETYPSGSVTRLVYFATLALLALQPPRPAPTTPAPAPTKTETAPATLAAAMAASTEIATDMSGVPIRVTQLKRHRGGTRLIVQIAIVLVAVVAALTRIPIAWHWPSDLLGATLLGASAARIVFALLSPERNTERGPQIAGS